MSPSAKYGVSKKTLLVDKLVSKLIGIGGISVIVAVLLIIFYLVLKVLPLFQEAKLTFDKTNNIEAQNISYITIDEWNSKPTFIHSKGINFLNLENDKEQEILFTKEFRERPLGFSNSSQTILLTNKNNEFSLAKINYSQTFIDQYVGNKQKSIIDVSLKYSKKFPIDEDGTISFIGYESTENSKLVAVILNKKNQYYLKTINLTQETDLFGDPSGELVIGDTTLIPLDGIPTYLLVSEQANNIIIATKDNRVLSFSHDENSSFSKVFQTIIPFEKENIASINFVYGSNSFICTNSTGQIKGYSFIRNKEGKRIFHNTKTGFKSLSKGASYFSISSRNKVFLIGNEKETYLMNLTTESINWKENLKFKVIHSLISPKYNKIFFLDSKNTLHSYELYDPHPEASFKTYFSKIWYESKNEPEYIWQSTGSSAQAEKKLSMIPLIYGTIKATIYTMIFSIPLALLAAIFTAQFASKRTRNIVKPIMEIMASLPSVIIGFIGALWLAPILQDRVPSLICCLIFIPLTTLFLGMIWDNLPFKIQILCKPGNEYLFITPIVLVFGYLSWQLGYIMEESLFVYYPKNDPNGIADFTRWWTQVTGLSYEQKNAIIVGISMGFAVIPIIFTISEDALNNVPKALTSASLALGASSWQTTAKIVIPAASPGIFSAIMIGFGRAVGETMIVLCAAGGTAILDSNPFNGMRTLSMNLAIELPEAPHNGTLFRSLYLGAVLLFMLTFIVNTIADLVRTRIRKKYASY